MPVKPTESAPVPPSTVKKGNESPDKKTVNQKVENTVNPAEVKKKDGEARVPRTHEFKGPELDMEERGSTLLPRHMRCDGDHSHVPSFHMSIDPPTFATLFFFCLEVIQSCCPSV